LTHRNFVDRVDLICYNAFWK